MSRRAVAPVVGVCLMLAVTVVLAALIGAFALGLGGQTENAPEAAITLDRNGNKILLTHMGGDTLDITELTVRIFVDGQPLEHQPDVSESNSDGFRYFIGEFSWTSGQWKAGETAGVFIATTTNSPQPTAGSRVTVRIYSNGEAVAVART